MAQYLHPEPGPSDPTHTPFHDSLFGRSKNIGIFYSKWKRSQARDLGFTNRAYWFDRDRRSSLPANMGRNMSLVWSPCRTAGTEPAPEVLTEEEDEVMEEGQAVGLVPSGSHGTSDSSESTQPVWTLEDDLEMDMELLPVRRTGMHLRSQTRMRRSQGSGDATNSGSSSSDGPDMTLEALAQAEDINWL
ncbi:hypothetical protein BGZ93_011236 [Podila epicladia]|nr:hypothetical protein BGZ92_000817 [Podila epicladia]KAG0086945.1 hypothetical protein BGZ93_011236 [Podila epicladia]